MKARSIAVVIAFACGLGLGLKAIAGPNDFFGSNVGGGNDTSQGAAAAPNSAAQAAAAAQIPAGPPSGDYTVDEKRVQHKFKDNCKRAQKLINRGEEMMRSKDEKVAKKGKVLKEIGEKALADLKANNPFPEVAASGKRTN